MVSGWIRLGWQSQIRCHTTYQQAYSPGFGGKNNDVDWLLREATWPEFWQTVDSLLGREFWNKKREEIEELQRGKR